MNIFQVVAIALIGSVLALTVKSFRPELSLGVSLAVGILLFSGTLSELSGILSQLLTLMEQNGIRKGYILTVIKIIGISYLTQFSAELCRDCGQNAIATKTELAGKIAILALMLPILSTFLNLVISALSFF